MNDESWHQQQMDERRRMEDELLNGDLEFQEWLDNYDSQFTQEEIVKMVDRSNYASGGESQWLKAADMKDKSFKVVISEVGETEMPSFDKEGETTTKLYLRFKDREKGIILNAANTQLLCDNYGPDDDGWAGKEIGLTSTYFKGVDKYGWRVEILDKEFDDSIPFAWLIAPVISLLTFSSGGLPIA